jgi:hypothetical protein
LFFETGISVAGEAATDDSTNAIGMSSVVHVLGDGGLEGTSE